MPQFSSDPPTSSVPIPIPKPDSSSGHDYREPSSRHAQCSSSRPWSSSPGYESDCPRGETSDSGSGNRDDFVTSTPIKPDKENQQRGNSSAATEEEEGAVWPLTSQYSTGRKHLREREANDVSGFVSGLTVLSDGQFVFHRREWMRFKSTRVWQHDYSIVTLGLICKF